MTHWNQSLGRAMMTKATDVETTTYAEKSKVRVGYPCAPDLDQAIFVQNILGPVESITTEVVWNCHQQVQDFLYQQQILKGRIGSSRPDSSMTCLF